MLEAKIFSNKVKELDQRFSFIMVHYINYYIQNGLSYDNNNEYYQPYMRLITTPVVALVALVPVVLLPQKL